MVDLFFADDLILACSTTIDDHTEPPSRNYYSQEETNSAAKRNRHLPNEEQPGPENKAAPKVYEDSKNTAAHVGNKVIKILTAQGQVPKKQAEDKKTITKSVAPSSPATKPLPRIIKRAGRPSNTTTSSPHARITRARDEAEQKATEAREKHNRLAEAETARKVEVEARTMAWKKFEKKEQIRIKGLNQITPKQRRRSTKLKRQRQSKLKGSLPSGNPYASSEHNAEKIMLRNERLLR